MDTDQSFEKLRTSTDIDVVEHEGRFEAIHTPTAKKYAITKDIAALLRGLDVPACMHDIYNMLGHTYSQVTISQAVTSLKEKHLVVSEKDTLPYFTTLPHTGLFGLQEYIQATEEQNTVLTGIPFGYGNGSDIRCQLFPSYLRSFIQSRKINLVKQADQADYRFVSSTTDFSSLGERILNNKIKDFGDLYLTSHESPVGVYQKIYRLALDIMGAQSIPIFIGGDHSITLPIVRAAAESHKAIQVLQFDAHTDTYPSSSQDNFTHHHGNFMTEILAMNSVKKVVQIGLRGFANRKSSLTNHPKQTTYWAGEIQDSLYRGGADIAIDNSLPTYVTFDIDFIDSAFAPGTATPVPNGFSYYETCWLFERLLLNLNIIGADVVEVNPKLDQETKTLEIAASIIILLMNYINVKS